LLYWHKSTNTDAEAAEKAPRMPSKKAGYTRDGGGRGEGTGGVIVMEELSDDGKKKKSVKVRRRSRVKRSFLCVPHAGSLACGKHEKTFSS
jgi:hypothetical protein